MNALDAKLNFKLRTLRNCAIVTAVFIPAVFVFAQMPFGWLGTIALIAILYYVFFHILQEWPTSFTCPHCHGIIATNTPWRCGSCGHGNRRTKQFPFVEECENCEASPKAYKCHHKECGKLIFLSKDNQEQGYATFLNLAEPAAPPVDKNTERKEAQDALRHELEMAELEAKRNEARKRATPDEPKPMREQIKASLNSFYTSKMGAREEAKRLRAEVAEKFKNDEQALKDANDTIDAWLIEHGIE